MVRLGQFHRTDLTGYPLSVLTEMAEYLCEVGSAIAQVG